MLYSFCQIQELAAAGFLEWSDHAVADKPFIACPVVWGERGEDLRFARAICVAPASVGEVGNPCQAPVPLEYSIQWLSCAFAGRRDAVLVSLPGAAQDRLRAH